MNNTGRWVGDKSNQKATKGKGEEHREAASFQHTIRMSDKIKSAGANKGSRLR
jgi:hypothetical protein